MDLHVCSLCIAPSSPRQQHTLIINNQISLKKYDKFKKLLCPLRAAGGNLKTTAPEEIYHFPTK